MNHCTFQAILQGKELRQTQDGQAIAEFVVTIDPLEEDPSENLKAIYWGESGEKAYQAQHPQPIADSDCAQTVVAISQPTATATAQELTWQKHQLRVQRQWEIKALREQKLDVRVIPS